MSKVGRCLVRCDVPERSREINFPDEKEQEEEEEGEGRDLIRHRRDVSPDRLEDAL